MSLLRSTACCFLGVGLSLCGPAAGLAAQVPDTTVLNPVIVTATRLNTPRSSVISTVSAVDGDALREQGVNTVAEALRMVAGLSVTESGSFGSATSVFMRGGESDYLKVLIDGVAANDPGGSYDFADLTLDNVERVEILRGPASVLYGSDAMAGVVQIFTKRGSGKPQLDAGIQGGTYTSFELDASANGGNDLLGFSVGLMRSATEGVYEYNSGYDNFVVSGAFSATPDDRTDAMLSARYGSSEFQYPTDASGQIVDANAFQANDRLSAALDVGRFLTRELEVRALLALNHTIGGIDDQPDDAADTVGFYGYTSNGTVGRNSVDVRANLYLTPTTVVTAGAQVERQAQQSTSRSMSQWGPSSDSLDVERINHGYYGQVQLAPIGSVVMNAGIRVDDNERFGTFGTYRAGTAVRIASGTAVRGSVGRAFKEPSFFENFANSPFAVGNPNLRPERSFSWELGLDQGLSLGGIVLGLTYFDQQFEDMIQFNAVPEVPGDPNYVNVAAARASGVEFEGQTSPSLPLRLGAHYTYLHTRVVDAGLDTGPDAGFVEGEKLLRRPTHRAGVNARYARFGIGSLTVNLDYVGSRDDRDFSEYPAKRLELPSYLKVDVAGDVVVFRSRGVRPRLRMTARVENLFGVEYQEVVGFPARGRVVIVGIRLGGR